MKIIESYMIFEDKEINAIKPHYFVTYGMANCCRFGHIAVKNLVDTLKLVLERLQETKANITEASNDKNIEAVKKLEKIEQNSYSAYYQAIFTILTKEEVHSIQKKIGYNFVSDEFYNEFKKYIESKEV